MLQSDNDLLRRRQRLLGDALAGRLSRRQIIQSGAALGLTATGLASLLGDVHRAAAQTPTASGQVVSWAPAGQRWELAQRAVYPLFQEKFPEITVEWIAEPEVGLHPTHRHRDVRQVGQVRHHAARLCRRAAAHRTWRAGADPTLLEQDADYMADILADVPENVMDLYRDKPLAAGGVLYGLPPDSNCQLQYYRSDVLEQAGFDGPAETWDDAIEIAKTLAESGTKQTGSSLKRNGLYSGTVFLTIVHTYGGDWFDKMGPGFFNPTLNSEAGVSALGVLTALAPYLEESSLNAGDDEANTAMANGAWTFAPVQWGGTTMNDPEYTEFADVWATAPVPKGNVEGGDHRPHMGGLGLAIPSYSHNKDAAWEFGKVRLLRRQAGPGHRQGLCRGHRSARARLAPQGIRAAPSPFSGAPGVAADRGPLPAAPGDKRALQRGGE